MVDRTGGKVAGGQSMHRGGEKGRECEGSFTQEKAEDMILKLCAAGISSGIRDKILDAYKKLNPKGEIIVCNQTGLLGEERGFCTRQVKGHCALWVLESTAVIKIKAKVRKGIEVTDDFIANLFVNGGAECGLYNIEPGTTEVDEPEDPMVH
jgi:hypothetical protein